MVTLPKVLQLSSASSMMWWPELVPQITCFSPPELTVKLASTHRVLDTTSSVVTGPLCSSPLSEPNVVLSLPGPKSRLSSAGSLSLSSLGVLVCTGAGWDWTTSWLVRLLSGSLSRLLLLSTPSPAILEQRGTEERAAPMSVSSEFCTPARVTLAL